MTSQPWDGASVREAYGRGRDDARREHAEQLRQLVTVFRNIESGAILADMSGDNRAERIRQLSYVVGAARLAIRELGGGVG